MSVSPSLIDPLTTAPFVRSCNRFIARNSGRTSLMAIIQEPALDLYKKDRAHITLDEVAEKMRTKDIHIRLYDAPGAGTARGAQAFVITFGYSDRFKAQQVVREITGKFEEYNFSLQRNQANTTANFLTDELKKAKERVDAAQEQIGGYGAQHPGELPQDAAQNMSLVNSKEQEIHTLEDTIEIGRAS